MSQLTDKLIKDLVNMRERVEANPVDIMRDMLIFLPLSMVNTPQATEVITLAKRVKRANVGSVVVMEKNDTRSRMNPLEGINISFGVNKGTDFDAFLQLLTEFKV